MMLVHHSRSTAGKQWDETKVHALQGAAKMLRTHVVFLAGLSDFGRHWTQLLR